MVECSILGLQPAPRSPDYPITPPAALLLPGGGELVLAAPNAFLQFYDLLHDRHIDRLQVWTCGPPPRIASPSALSTL